MPTVLLPILGRLGNILFQVAYAKAWCEQNGYELSMHPWIGERVFNFPKSVRPEKYRPDLIWPERMYQDQSSLIYTRNQVRSWFSFKPEVLERLKPILNNRHMAILDVREGEDIRAAGLVTLTRQCYIDAARERGFTPDNYDWEIGPHGTRLPGFAGNVDSCGLGVGEISIPAFYRLMTADVHFRANSTFSWWAATLGDAKVYSPIIRGMQGGLPPQDCKRFVEGNWPVMADVAPNTDLHLSEDSGNT